MRGNDRRRARSLLACALALAACEGPVKRAILRRNDALVRAIAARDVEALANLAAPDFRYRTPEGRDGDRAAWLEGVKTFPGAIESISNDHLQLREEGFAFVLCGVQRAVVLVEGRRVADETAFCDRWEQRGGQWFVTYASPPASAQKQ